MSNKDFRDVRKSVESKQNEIVKAHYVGAAVLMIAATAFLMFVFALDRVFDLSRFAY